MKNLLKKNGNVTVGAKGVIKYMDKKTKLHCSNNHCTSQYEPLLVTPTKFKIYENRILKHIWELSLENISMSEEIVFIGYSLPEADAEIRCLLLNAMNKSINKPKITLVAKENDNSNTKKNYLELFGNVEIHEIGFKKYVKNILS